MNDSAMNEPTPSSANPPPASTPPPRAWDVACHLSAFLGYPTGGVGWVIGPLIVWLLKRADLPSVEAHGKESLNFHLSIFLYGLALTLLGFFSCGVGWFLLIALAVFQIVCTILAAIRASNGEFYRYPLTIRLVK